MKPNGTPEPPDGCPITPRITSIRRVREMEVAYFELPIDDCLLCEVLPFAHSTDSDGIQWIAVRLTVDLPGTPASIATSGWLARELLEELPHLRELIRVAPDDLAPLASLQKFERSFAASNECPSPSKTHRNVSPCDGESLLAAWRSGRRPVVRTFAYLEMTLPHLPDSHAAAANQALQILRDRRFRRADRAALIVILDGVVRFVGGWGDWPPTAALDSVNPFPDGIFDDIDFDDLFGGDEPDDPSD